MNHKLRQRLEKTIQIAQCLLDEKAFHVSNSEIDSVPVPVLTQNAARKKGLVLKRGAKPVGTWEFHVGSSTHKGKGTLYLATSFKPKEGKA